MIHTRPLRLDRGGRLRFCTRFLKAVSIMFLISWMKGSEPGHAQSALSEPQVKALFLFNFAKYVEWPTQAFSDTNSPITIGILGASPCGQYLQKAVEGKSVAGRSIVVRRIEQLEDVRVCQILF